MNFKSLFKLVKNSTFGKVENSTRDLEKRPLTNLGNDDSEEISDEEESDCFLNSKFSDIMLNTTMGFTHRDPAEFACNIIKGPHRLEIFN